MAMGVKSSKAEINVTPMIDVLLVLLIIFMVILPDRSVGLNVQVPQPSDGQDRPLPAQNIVLTALGGGRVRLNQSDLSLADLPERLRALSKHYSPGIAFVKGEANLDFAQIAEVIDVAKGSGWKQIGLLPKEQR